MITPCARCKELFVRDVVTDAVCARCASLAELLDCADSFVLWRLKVEVTSGGDAAEQLTALIERIEGAAAKVRAS